MDRKEVYKALDSEREYQEKMTINVDRPDNPEDSYQDTMEHLRKLGGMIVQMGEKYGIPKRK